MTAPPISPAPHLQPAARRAHRSLSRTRAGTGTQARTRWGAPAAHRLPDPTALREAGAERGHATVAEVSPRMTGKITAAVDKALAA